VIAIVKKWLKYYNMAAVTGTIIALGGLGLSAAQAIKANQDMKTASKAAAKAAGELKNIKEFNAFKQVQVPTLGFNLAQQSQAQAEAQALQSLQGAGAEGVIGGVGNVLQAGNEQTLNLAAQANQAQYARDIAQAEAEQGIQSRKAERDFYAGINELQSAQMQRAAAEEMRNAAIEGMFSSAGTALTSGSKAVGLYKKSKGTNVKGGGVNWNLMSNNQLPQGINPITQGNQYYTGSTINNSTANALTGNIPGQVTFY
jgi:hypothetical protein